MLIVIEACAQKPSLPKSSPLERGRGVFLHPKAISNLLTKLCQHFSKTISRNLNVPVFRSCEGANPVL